MCGYTFSLFGALDEGGWSKPRPDCFTPSAQFTRGWVGPQPVWTSVKNLAPTGFRSTDPPARSESLCGLRLKLTV